MSYREITVNDVDYLWETNNTHTKVRIGRHGKSTSYLNSEWGTLTGIRSDYHDYTYVVAPADVRGMILGERHWKPTTGEK